MVAVISLVATLLIPSIVKATEKDNQKRCANNLKQIALAAVQYSDDNRYFPHVGPIDKLDPGWASPVAVKCVRTLAQLDYDDNPETFVCPSSRRDQATPLSAWVPAKDGHPVAPAPLTPLPLYLAGNPSLDQVTNLSYGWTRRGLTTNCCGSCPLLVGDRSRALGDLDRSFSGAHTGNMIGNHTDCMQFACIDGHTIRLTPTTDILTTANIGATKQYSGGFMGVLDDSEDQ